jgi:hypothetical protein
MHGALSMHRAILSNSKEIFSNKNIIRTSVDDCYPVAVFGLLVFCSTARTFVGQYNDVFCGFWGIGLMFMCS